MLFRSVAFVLGSQAVRDGQGGHLGRGHVPPDPGARQVGVRDDGYHDHDRAGVAAGGLANRLVIRTRTTLRPA